MLESDYDKVADYLDKYSNTPKGFNVDKNGCSVIFTFVIHFDNNNAKIKPEYMEKIKKFAELFKTKPIKAEIQEYTGNRRSAVYNQKLLQRRAKAVYEALIKFSIDKNRFSY